MFKGQRNFYVQLLAMVLVLFAAWYFPLSGVERAILVLIIAAVLAAEVFNTAIEHIVDWINPKYNKKAAVVKDFAAAAVLILALASIAIAILIFFPYFRNLTS
jgi:diacylglycerol kinase